MSTPKPVYLLAGGPGTRRRTPDPLLSGVLAAAAKPRPSVAYIGAPSDDSRMFYLMLSRLMRGSGAGRVDFVRLAGQNPDLAAARSSIDAADVVFMTGGDVEHGMAVLARTSVLPVLRARLEAGALFFGLSAGSIMLASRWVRWEDPEDEASVGLFPCMGFAPVVCDTHGEADDWVELVAAVRLLPEGSVGYGIATNTGLEVSPDGSVRALGGTVHRYRSEAGGAARIEDLTP